MTNLTQTIALIEFRIHYASQITQKYIYKKKHSLEQIPMISRCLNLLIWWRGRWQLWHVEVWPLNRWEIFTSNNKHSISTNKGIFSSPASSFAYNFSAQLWTAGIYIAPSTAFKFSPMDTKTCCVLPSVIMLTRANLNLTKWKGLHLPATIHRDNIWSIK